MNAKHQNIRKEYCFDFQPVSDEVVLICLQMLRNSKMFTNFEKTKTTNYETKKL